MAYTKTTWVNGTTPANATNMNKIEKGIEEASKGVDEIKEIKIVGEIKMYAGTTAPTGFLMCDGSAVSRSKYSNLYNVIGTTFGAGDGSTTFNLPNLTGKFVVGKNENNILTSTIGKTGGSENLQANVNFFMSGTTLYTDQKKITGSAYTENQRYSVGTGTDGGNIGETSALAIAVQGIEDGDSCLPPYMVLNYIIKY